MASDRVIIVRIAGCGTSSGGQYEFTSRAGLSYLDNEVAGVVSDLGPQFTSEIGIFAAMGSDPTTSITMLTTPTTLRAFNSRAQLPVRNAANELVTMASYCQPTASMTFDVSDGSALSIGSEYRVHMTTFFVTNITGNTIDALRSRGCGISPIPMTKVGEAVIGATIYDARDGSPQGGCDSMPITISTAEITAANRAAEEVIFRGIVTRASNDTSARNGNLIRIEAGSMLGYAKNAQFRPPIAQTSLVTFMKRFVEIGGRTAYSMTAIYVDAKFDPRTDGFATDGSTGNATAYDALQLRQEGSGGIVMRINGAGGVIDVTPTSQTLSAASVPGIPGAYAGAESGGWTFIIAFVDGTYGNATLRASGISQFENILTDAIQWNRSTEENQSIPTEICFLADSPVNLILDLLLGTHNGNFSDGYRAAQQAAWLPYDGIYTQPEDLIDYASLLAVLEGREDVFPRIEFVPWYAEETVVPASYYVMPYDAGADKTIGAILERIMQKLGACMLYDRGVVRFVSWASASGFPVPVIDAHFSAPAARLTFDNGACLQSANCDVMLRIDGTSFTTSGELIEQPIPVVNVLLGPQQRGKQMKVGTFRQLTHGMPQALALTSFAFANAAIVRFSNPAPMLGVSLRDAACDLDIGQSVIVSSAFVPNAFGTMGLENAAGIVIKAARSWATPTTDYSIMLTGYLNAVSGIALISPAGTVTLVAGNDIKIADNDFTRTFPVSSSSPINDADAFKQVSTISGVSPLPVQLLDQYGTLIATDICTVDVTNSLLQFAGVPFGGAASPGDIVVLDTAANYFPATMWDAFLANNVGEVAGSQSNAREWSS